jgi:hypothetical protein
MADEVDVRMREREIRSISPVVMSCSARSWSSTLSAAPLWGIALAAGRHSGDAQATRPRTNASTHCMARQMPTCARAGSVRIGPPSGCVTSTSPFAAHAIGPVLFGLEANTSRDCR